MGIQTFDERLPIHETVQLDNSAGTADATLRTVGNLPEHIDAIWLTTDSAVGLVVRLTLGWDLNNILGSVSVPAGAGLAGTPPIDLLSCLPDNPQGGLILLPGVVLKGSVETAIVSGKTLYVTVVGGQL